MAGPSSQFLVPFSEDDLEPAMPLLKFVFQRLLKVNEDGSLVSRPSHQTLRPSQIQCRLKMESLPPEACLLTLNGVGKNLCTINQVYRDIHVFLGILTG